MSEIEVPNLGSEDEEEDEDDPSIVIDSNTCSDMELEKQFVHYSINCEEAISLKQVFALNLDFDSTFNKFCTSMSNGSVEIFNIDYNNSLMRFGKIDNLKSVTESKFLDSNTLLVCSDNVVSLYDLRTKVKCHTFEDKSDENVKKPMICFDINANGRLICTGTEQYLNEVFMLFFDIRKKSALGGYWESHQDDITAVKFHPTDADMLVSGSTDGLVNIFDVSKSTEDEALQCTINTDNSVQKLNWHKNSLINNNKDIISCITHTNDLKIYDAEEGDVICEHERSTITNAMKRKSADDCNLINCHSKADNSIFLLAGSNFHKGEILRSLQIDKEQFKPFANYCGNKQIIRDSLFNPKNNNLITCGEAGIVTLWSLKDEDSFEKFTPSLKAASSSKLSTHTKKPY